MISEFFKSIFEELKRTNFLIVAFFLPMFWFVPVSSFFYYFYAAACGILIVTTVCCRRSLRFTPDPLFFWLVGYGVFVFWLDILNGGKSFLFTAHLLFSLTIIGFVLFYRFEKRELLWLTVIGIGTSYVADILAGRPFTDTTGAAYVGAVVMALLMFRRYAVAVVVFLWGFSLLTRSALLGMGVAAAGWYVLRISRRSQIVRRCLMAVLIMALVAMPIVIGKYFRDSAELFEFTTSRAYYYQVLWDQFSQRGRDAILPVSNSYSTEVLTEHILKTNWDKSYLERFFKNIPYQSAHSVYLEFLFNYGIIIACVFLGWLVFLETPMTWPILACFYIVIAFQCEVFAPRFLVPFYIVYRIMYLEERKREGPHVGEQTH